jgi:hypothetical protein
MLYIWVMTMCVHSEVDTKILDKHSVSIFSPEHFNNLMILTDISY